MTPKRCFPHVPVQSYVIGTSWYHPTRLAMLPATPVPDVWQAYTHIRGAEKFEFWRRHLTGVLLYRQARAILASVAD